MVIFFSGRKQMNANDEKKIKYLLEQAQAERSRALACDLRIEASHQREAARQCSNDIMTEAAKIVIKAGVNIIALGTLGQTLL